MDRTAALAALAALGQETRLDVFRLLVKAGPAGLSAGRIAAGLGALPNTLSAHLRILGAAGLVRRERAGRSIRYRAELDAMRELVLFLLEDCCRGEPSVCTPIMDALAC